jgi:putative oxidoreductase
VAEFGGGPALILGFKTRLATLGIIATLVVAVRKGHWTQDFVGQGRYELPLQFLAPALASFVTGSGAISLDALCGRTTRNAKRNDVEVVAAARAAACHRVV